MNIYLITGQDGEVDEKVKSSPFKEAENDVDIESIFDDVSGHNASIQSKSVSNVPSLNKIVWNSQPPKAVGS